MTHIFVDNLTILGSDNGLSPGRRQAIIWTNGGILLIGPLGTNFSEILIKIQTFSLKKIRLKISSAKCCSFRLGLNVLTVVMCLSGGIQWGRQGRQCRAGRGPGATVSAHRTRQVGRAHQPPTLGCTSAASRRARGAAGSSHRSLQKK